MKRTKNGMRIFLERSDITYTTPGRRDNFYVGMNGGKWEHKLKRYLFWKLRDLLEIINGSKIITNENFPSLTEGLKHESHFAKCTFSSESIRKWLTTVASHTRHVYVKSVKSLHF